MRVLTVEYHAAGSKENPELEQDAPMIDVPEVMLDAPRNRIWIRGRASAAVHLRPTGYAWLNVVAEGIVGNHAIVVGVVGFGMWPWSDERHVPSEHIEQLRQLVEACSP